MKIKQTLHKIQLSINHDNVVELNYPSEIELNLEQAQCIDKIIFDNTYGEDIYLIINMENSFGTLSSEAQAFFAQEAPTIPQVRASAIILNNLSVRILVKVYIRVFKPTYLTKVFSNSSDAYHWIKTQKNKRQHLSN